MSRLQWLKGDITKLDVDVIVNAANRSLLGGGGVDGAIHRAAGPRLLEECKTLGGCQFGEAKITKGYDLPYAKFIIHTVGPIIRSNTVSDEQRELLRNCYWNSLELAKKYNLKSIAFPCISTGVYSFPQDLACDIVIDTANDWIRKNSDYIIHIIFCLFNDIDVELYKKKLGD
ncbi:unnamed protein product [Bursaphelenchus xylophilus]|uniref:(pine wood nematode) hypothetical protein n=1 Tax=Bursaphelenchus xylophilus TaxID=6326 RepID=A0A1I7RKT9_BURXY|nr:unnamed protein product [Bursaphelenchus xylophilus]CAG9131104.1 unnamed protein product [Bursaphelenchus xylophilus]